MNDLIQKNNTEISKIVDEIVIKQDMSQLSPAQRVEYVKQVCATIGLNPLTRPFDFINFQGRLVLYATKDCAAQLRKIHGISIQVVSREIEDDTCFVHVRATDRTGRVDEDFAGLELTKPHFENRAFKGNVKLTGQERMNALMKVVTKAKRRVTLSICGLGFLDEDEIHDTKDLVESKTIEQNENDERFETYEGFKVFVNEEQERDYPVPEDQRQPDENFVIQFGVKYRGFRFADLSVDELKEYREDCLKRFAKKNFISLDEKNFLECSAIYLKNCEYKVKQGYMTTDEVDENSLKIAYDLFKESIKNKSDSMFRELLLSLIIANGKNPTPLTYKYVEELPALKVMSQIEKLKKEIGMV